MPHPYILFASAALALSGAVTFAASFLIPLPAAWLVAINLTALALYRYDKHMAGTRRTRVPERVLLLVAALGGSVGAALAMWVVRPRHKTRSGRFVVWVLLIMSAHALLLLMAVYRG